MKIEKCFWCKSEKLEQKTIRKDDNPILQCAKCQLLMVGNVPENLSDLYQSSYFEKSEDSTSIGYENYLSSPTANIIGNFAFSKLFVHKDQSNCLDIGCADGSLVEMYQSYGFNAQGLDISRDAIKIGQNKDLSVSVSDLKVFPCQDQSFDFVTAFDLIEHLDNPKKTLTETLRVLKNNGLFFYSTVCVNQVEKDNFWFNTSLEHLIYYNQKVFQTLLEEVFGKGSVLSVNIKVGGVSEIFGIAKRGKINSEERLIFETIFDNRLFEDNKSKNYYLSLFYDKIGRFNDAKRAIVHTNYQNDTEEYVFLTFLNFFYQGQFLKAIDLIKNSNVKISLSNSVFWQAYSFVLDHTANLYEKMALKKAQEVMKIKKEIEEITNQNHEITNQISEMKQMVDTKNVQIEEILNQNHELTNQISEMKQMVDTKNVQIEEILNQNHELTNQLSMIQASKFWKMRNHYMWLKSRPKVFLQFVLSTPSRLELFFVALGREHLSEVHKKFLRQFLRNKYKVEFIPFTHQKWEGPLITIVTPYYNRGGVIAETINSVLTQTFKNFEYIIVDDGSDPEHQSILEEVCSERIKIIRQKNQGVSSARNNGIREANGKYVLCLDSDDTIEPTYLEKALIAMEQDPAIGIVYSELSYFGEKNEHLPGFAFDPLVLENSNFIPTAAIFRRALWEQTDGYKDDLGYEDWEFWINLVERGAIAKLIPEALFNYRVVKGHSKYAEDFQKHHKHIEKINYLHRDYKKHIQNKFIEKMPVKYRATDNHPYINLDNSFYNQGSQKKNVLIVLPWMTFGGAERVVINFCNELNDAYKFSFITSLKSSNEWEEKFTEISDNIYHLPNLFEREEDYLAFVQHYIKTRDIEILHIVHNSSFFDMLPLLKKEFPRLKVVNTVFNTVAHFEKGIEMNEYIDAYTTDNSVVEKTFLEASKKETHATIEVIHNGIDNKNQFNPALLNREEERNSLRLSKDDLSVFYIGRLSSEKCPDVFVDAAQKVLEKSDNVRFFIVGDGPMKENISKQISQSKSHGKIQFLGYKPDVAQYLSAADIFVLPSKAEGFPLSNVEAMAMGAVVVANDVGGVADAIQDGHNGFLIDPSFHDAIVDKILYINNHKEIIEAMVKNAQDDVQEKFTISVMGNKYRSLYKKLLCQK